MTRRIDERHIEPSQELDGINAGHGPWTKLVSVPMITRTDLTDAVYPATVKTREGEVTFTSRKHQEIWMEANGYVRTADVCDDNTFNESVSTGFFDQYDPPTDADLDQLKQTQWVDQSQVSTAS